MHPDSADAPGRPRQSQAQGRRRRRPRDHPVLLLGRLLLPLPRRSRGGRHRRAEIVPGILPVSNFQAMTRDSPACAAPRSRLARPTCSRGSTTTSSRAAADRRHRRRRAVRPALCRRRRPLPFLHAQPRRAQLRDLPLLGVRPPGAEHDARREGPAAARIGAEAHPDQGRRLRHDDPEHRLDEAGLSRRPRPSARPEGQQRPAEPDPARRGARDLQELRRRRRRHRSRPTPSTPTRISQADYGAEALVARDQPSPRRGSCARSPTPLRRSDGKPRWVAGALGPTNKTLSLSPDVNDPGFREVDFDEVKAVYREQIDGAGRGRRRLHPDRDGVRHAERQGGDHRRRRGGRGARPRAAADDLDDADRPFRPQPLGPHGRGVLGTRCATPGR